MQDLSGRTLGHYRIGPQIGAGGMGVVFRARDERLDRDVAIKVLPAELATDPERLRRFEREAKAVAALSHPNILEIFDFDTEGGVKFSVIELLVGETLYDYLHREGGPLPWRRALEIGAAVAGGLAAAHSKGVVHRDIKPSNIFLCTDGRVKILDFGLAATHVVLDSKAETCPIEPPLTQQGTVMGTVGYMSPEQAAGRSVDHRTDLFSLGTVLFEMLAGRCAFRGDSQAATLAALLRDSQPPLTGVSPKVARLVTKCLEKDPGNRFQSADELKAVIEESLAPPAVHEGASIAVLPFTNMSGDEENSYLCEGIAEEVINALTRVPGLRVIARTSSFAVGGMRLDVREVGQRLNVDTILEGSVRRVGQRVRVTAQLVTTDDGSHLWSERFDRELTDILTLEDEIAETIADRLRVKQKEADRRSRRPTVDPAAYALFLEGRHHFARGTPDAMARAVRCFERALTLDATHALTHDSLAELYWYSGFFGGLTPREAFSQGVWHSMRALELDDGLAETHALLGMLRKELDYDWTEVDHKITRARELNRESPIVRLRYAISCLLPHGRIDEAANEIAAMLQSDPLSVLARWWVSTVEYLRRHPDRMLEEGQHMIELDPNHFLGHLATGLAYSECGAPDHAVVALETARDLSRGVPITIGYLAFAYGRAGRRGDGLRLLECLEATATGQYVPPSTFALGHVGLQDWDAAFRWWDQAIEVRDPLVVPIKTFPFFDPVRADSRYRALLRKMNLSED
jgi:serine/threonine protein kinase